MKHGRHPDAIDTRFVLRVYAWIAIAAGVYAYAKPNSLPAQIHETLQLIGTPDYARFSLTQIPASAIVFAGICAAGLAGIADPISRRRGLLGFAIAHLVFGLMFGLQIIEVLSTHFPPYVGWIPFAVGLVLLYVAITCAHAPRLHRLKTMIPPGPDLPGTVVIDRAVSTTMVALRSQYEEQIRQAARLEERARLARDLHDAVKQQLFAIQTSAATAQARYGSDAAGAQSALDQIRVSARDAMVEMEAMFGHLQAAPVENTGLVAALEHQCEALRLRTGANVRLETGTLPSSDALLPGAQQAIFRVAQEALSNVARHARASTVIVRLGLTTHDLELTIQDDGTGFDMIETPRGMGMKNMQERVGEAAGTFVLRSKPGGGTTVGFSVPCDASTTRDYLRKALIWTLVLAATIVLTTIGGGWERPWPTIVAAIAAVTAARFVIASYRVRNRAEALV
jgi:signal transduction histidine kinase